MTSWNTAYPELGGVHEIKRMYKEGERFIHPSGTVYVRKGGIWVIQEEQPRERQEE